MKPLLTENLLVATRDAVSKAVAQIKKAGNKAVVVTGIQDENAQLLALAINNALQSEVIDVVSTKMYVREIPAK